MTVKNFISTEIEWIPINNVIISKDIFDEISDFLDYLIMMMMYKIFLRI